MIYFTSDTHFGHDRDFVWKARGFKSVEEMNEEIVKRFNSIVTAEDDLYILGDVIMGDPANIEYVKRLNGKLHILLGNHDTPTRRRLYATAVDNVVEICEYATVIKYKKQEIYLSHYPTMVINEDVKEVVSLKQCVLNFFGHTHQTERFYNNDPRMFHVGVDSNNCYPVPIDDILDVMKEKLNKVKGE
jgi:calcineurin-like phosphoesterase family protein